MKPPRLPQTYLLLALLMMLMVGSMINNSEALRFCEKALYGETLALEKDKMLKQPIAFTAICPEVRERIERNINKWLEVVLALMVQFSHPSDPPAP